MTGKRPLIGDDVAARLSAKADRIDPGHDSTEEEIVTVLDRLDTLESRRREAERANKQESRETGESIPSWAKKTGQGGRSFPKR